MDATDGETEASVVVVARVHEPTAQVEVTTVHAPRAGTGPAIARPADVGEGSGHAEAIAGSRIPRGKRP